MEDKELIKVHDMINDLWKFEKKYYCPQSMEEYWKDMNEDLEKLRCRHNSELMNQLLIVCLDDIERRAGNKSGDGYKALWNRLRG